MPVGQRGLPIRVRRLAKRSQTAGEPRAHLTMNGRKINVPGAQVKTGDIISVRERSRTLISIQAALESVDGRGIPEWLEPGQDGL